MSAPGPTIDTTAISNIAVRDTNRLVGSVAKALAANSPWINVLRGGIFKSGTGDTVLGSVEMQAAPGDSLAQPGFTANTLIAGTTGTSESTGKVTMDYVLESKRGLGPKVNVKQGYGAFKSSYLSAEDALRKLITQYMNADIQYNLVYQAGSKFSCKAGQTLQQNFGGGTEANRKLPWNWTGWALPDAPLTFKALHAIARYLKEALFAEMFPAGDKGQAHFRFIGSSDIVEAFRNETGVNASLVALTTGGYKLGEQGISGYSFETSPAYRGLAFGVTHRPLRFTAMGTGAAPDNVATSQPQFINPVKVIAAGDGTNQAYAVAEPNWLGSTYEVGVLIAEGSFERQVPEEYVGEGSFKFAPQLHMGELEWHYLKDNDTNMYGDFGWHKYQISRAYRPLRPQFVVPIMYKRAVTDLGLTAI
jgi:hypothetical protein